MRTGSCDTVSMVTSSSTMARLHPSKLENQHPRQKKKAVGGGTWPLLLITKYHTDTAETCTCNQWIFSSPFRVLSADAYDFAQTNSKAAVKAFNHERIGTRIHSQPHRSLWGEPVSPFHTILDTPASHHPCRKIWTSRWKPCPPSSFIQHEGTPPSICETLLLLRKTPLHARRETLSTVFPLIPSMSSSTKKLHPLRHSKSQTDATTRTPFTWDTTAIPLCRKGTRTIVVYDAWGSRRSAVQDKE